MSYHEYKESQDISRQGFTFYAIIMAAMRQADTDNIIRLRIAFPEVYQELDRRYHAPDGLIDGEVLGGGT